MIEFEGLLLKKSKIIGLSKVKCISTGSLLCDWVYGFEIYMEGGTTIPIMDQGGGTRDACHVRAREARETLVAQILEVE